MDKEEMGHSLAWEMLTEVKASAKRWFIAFCIMTGLEIATICGFMWYISLPVDSESESTTIENDDGNANYIGNDLNGDLNNGENNKDQNPDEKSSESSQRRDN